jgi:putative pyruvate formate lyase activating enzyme
MRQKTSEMKQQKINRIENALDRLSKHVTSCKLCPRECGVNRKKGEKGFCGISNQAILSHAVLHFGEEPVLSGYHDCAEDNAGAFPQKGGSGALFFAGCNLKCCFCQNYQLSWLNQGEKMTPEEIASHMLALQEKGALNINLVSPTHIVVPLLKALKLAYARGLNIPLVYNSNGYEKREVIRHLKGIVDIYLPDCKYHSPRLSQDLSGASDYFTHAGPALLEMYRQQPTLECDANEIARKGLIIRHLVLPGQSEESLRILEWIAQQLSPSVCLSLMSQYWPCFKAPSSLQKTLDPEEYGKIMDRAFELGFDSLFIQPEPFVPEEHRTPDFNRTDPFDWT